MRQQSIQHFRIAEVFFVFLSHTATLFGLSSEALKALHIIYSSKLFLYQKAAPNAQLQYGLSYMYEYSTIRISFNKHLKRSLNVYIAAQIGVILYVMDGPYRLPFPYRTGCPDKSCPLPSFGLIR
jgi:hypothetical protein